MEKRAAQLDFNQAPAAQSLAQSETRRFAAPSKALWLFVMALQALSGFFVAKIPVRPELAHISALFVVLFAWPCYRAVVKWLGWQRGVRLLLVLGIYALLLESAAIVTGLPYGHFVYGEKIGALVFGIVPWTVPFAWTPLLCAAVAMARRYQAAPGPLILLSGLILVAIDMVLDPGAVAQGFWRYEASGAFYNVPAQNFFGWLLTGSAAACLMWSLAPQLRREAPPVGLIGSSLLILSFWSSVCFWMALWLPACVGIVLLAVFARAFFAGD